MMLVWPGSEREASLDKLKSDRLYSSSQFTREIYNLDPQPHRHGMLAPKPSAPQVTQCRLGKYWSRDFFQKEAESSGQGVGNPEPCLFSLPLSRSDRLPRR